MAYINDLFNHLHQIPELAFEEKKTSKFIANELRKMNYDVLEGVGGTGVIGILRSDQPGPKLAIRADMDALPFIIDESNVAIHACGHDANSSMALSTAKRISETGIKKGTIIFLFQPGEESGKGAKAMVDSGQLPQIDEMIGIHFRDTSELVLGQATPALKHSGVAAIKVKFIGKSCHGARPHQGINTIDVAVSAINAINAIHGDPRIAHSVKVTKFNTQGTAFNIIPDVSNIAIDLRTQSHEMLDELIQKVENAVKGACLMFGADYEFEVPIRLNAANYNEELVSTASSAIKHVLGSVVDEIQTTGSEDFHYFTEALHIKTAVIGLGANLTTGLHHPDMSFDQKALEYGEAILTKIVKLRLG